MNPTDSKVSEKFNTDHLESEQKIICCGGGTERAFQVNIGIVKKLEYTNVQCVMNLSFPPELSLILAQVGPAFFNPLLQVQ